MTMIDFIKKHEKVLQRDPNEAAIASLKTKLEELQSLQPDYQQIADRIYSELKEKDLLPQFDNDGGIKVGDEVIGIGTYRRRDLDGLRGKIVGVQTLRNEGTFYAVEWERKVNLGHDCDGTAKDGYGLYVNEKSFRKDNLLQKPRVSRREDYDTFLNKLEKAVKREPHEEYLDPDEDNYLEGDEVELLVDFVAAKKGERGTIKRKSSGGCEVIFSKSIPIFVYDEEMARVKKRKSQVPDQVKRLITKTEEEFKLAEYGEKVDEVLMEVQESARKVLVLDETEKEELAKMITSISGLVSRIEGSILEKQDEEDLENLLK